MALLDRFGRPLVADEVAEPVQRQDRWQNGLTGIGTYGDKAVHGRFFPVHRVLDQELTSLHSGSDIAKKIVDKRCDEMFRRGWDAEADKVKASEVQDVLEYCEEFLDLEANMREAMRWGRLYGGCLALLGVDDGQDPWMPLDEDKIKSFDFISVVDRRFAYVQSEYASIAQGKSKYGKPQIYLVSSAVAASSWTMMGSVKKKTVAELKNQGASVALWHESRVVRFEGAPADVVTRQALAGWSWSVLQSVYDAMRQFEHSFDSVGHLLSDASQGVFKLQGLVKAITSGQRQALADRIQIMEMTRSAMRGIAIDAGSGDGKNAEEFTRIATPFGGIPDLLDKMMLRLAGAADMPATELFGRAPAGLSATGESDTRKWYDTISSEQTKSLTPKLARVLRLLSLAKTGPLKGRDVKWKIEYKPLWSPTDKEVADVEKTQADTANVYITAQVIKPEEVAVGLKDVYPHMDVEAREAILEAGQSFEPYPNDKDETEPGEEPHSPAVPVPVLGGPEGGPKAPPGQPPPDGAKGGAGATPMPVAEGGKAGASSGAAPTPAAAARAAGVAGGTPPGKGAPAAKGAGAPAAPAKKPAAPKAPPIAVHNHLPKGSTGVGAPAEKPAKASKKDAAEHEDAAAIVIAWNDEDEVITVSRPEPPHEMALPGGIVDPGETPAEAAARELKEETGLEAEDLVEVAKLATPGGIPLHVFRAGSVRGEAYAAEDDSEVAWMGPQALFAQARLLRNTLSALMRKGLLAPPAPPPASTTVDRADGGVVYAVHKQLAEDYPEDAIGWVRAASWSGPKRVPLDQVDFDGQDTWAAAHEPEKVAAHAERIASGIEKPIILVKRPGLPGAFIADGHHRSMAYQHLGKPVMAYVATVPTVEGPWDAMHSLQEGRSTSVQLLSSSQKGGEGPSASPKGDDVSAADSDDDVTEDGLDDPFDGPGERYDRNVHGSKWIRPEKRAAIYIRDGGRCVYCAKDDHLSLDHVIPRELGGTSDAHEALYAPLQDWIHHPSHGAKEEVLSAYKALPDRQKELLAEDVAEAFQREHGSDEVVAYRYKGRSELGGISLSTHEPVHLAREAYTAYRVKASDVLAHWGQPDLPLGNKSFGHEKELILKPDASPPVTETPKRDGGDEDEGEARQRLDALVELEDQASMLARSSATPAGKRALFARIWDRAARVTGGRPELLGAIDVLRSDDDDFEGKHPRGAGGKFGESGAEPPTMPGPDASEAEWGAYDAAREKIAEKGRLTPAMFRDAKAAPGSLVQLPTVSAKTDSDFDEEKHPRGPDGKFGGGGPPDGPENAQKRMWALPLADPSAPGGDDPLMGAKSDDDFEARSAERASATTEAERNAVGEFTRGTGAFGDVRAFERDPEGFAAKHPRQIEAWESMRASHKPEEAGFHSAAERDAHGIAGFFAKAEPTPGVVYRGMAADDAKLHALLGAETITMPATSSSSRHAEVGIDFAGRGSRERSGTTPVVFRLRQKSGVAIEHTSRNPQEKEILLRKGTTFKVTNRSQTGGYLIIDGEES